MPFWKFRRDSKPADAELVSRVVTATTRDGARMRGKLTLHFAEPQPTLTAEESGDRAASLGVSVLADCSDHKALLEGGPSALEDLADQVRKQLPPETPPLRGVDFAALHVLGDLSSSAVRPPMPSHHGGDGGRAPGRSISSSQMLAVTGNRMVMPGSSPETAGRALSRALEDAAARLLLGFLRVYDLVVVREIPLDPSMPEQLTALVPVSDVEIGGFEASRKAELDRWRQTLGQEGVDSIKREAGAVALFLLDKALERAGVIPVARSRTLAALVDHSFTEDEQRRAEQLDAFEQLPSQIRACLLRAASVDDEHEELEVALGPLLHALRGDLELVGAHTHAGLDQAAPAPAIPTASES